METARSSKCDNNIEGGSMKLLCIILSFAILLAGCYSHTTVTKDTPNLDNKEVTFRLLWMKDGTIKYIYNQGEAYIISKQYHRIENGYEVTGNHVYERYNNSSRDFSGVLRDDQIKEVVCSELDVTKTVVAVSLGGLFLILFISTVNAAQGAMSFSLKGATI